jgi:DNA-binding MarR family transcriptional regulator
MTSIPSKRRSPQPVSPDPHDETLHPLESRAVFLLSQIGHLIASTFSEKLEPHKIQPRHFAVLNGLTTNDGASQQQLADALAIHRNVMVGIVDDLERHGYAKREAHPDDRRAHAVRLTTRGRSVLKSAHATANTLESEVTKILSAAERIKFIDSLQRLAESLSLQPGSHPSLHEKK